MLKALNKTGLVFFPAFDWAIDPTHPEREERLLYTQDQVTEEGIFDINGIIEYKPDLVTYQDIQRAHFCVPDEKNHYHPIPLDQCRRCQSYCRCCFK